MYQPPRQKERRDTRRRREKSGKQHEKSFLKIHSTASGLAFFFAGCVLVFAEKGRETERRGERTREKRQRGGKTRDQTCFQTLSDCNKCTDIERKINHLERNNSETEREGKTGDQSCF